MFEKIAKIISTFIDNVENDCDYLDEGLEVPTNWNEAIRFIGWCTSFFTRCWVAIGLMIVAEKIPAIDKHIAY